MHSREGGGARTDRACVSTRLWGMGNRRGARIEGREGNGRGEGGITPTTPLNLDYTYTLCDPVFPLQSTCSPPWREFPTNGDSPWMYFVLLNVLVFFVFFFFLVRSDTRTHVVCKDPGNPESLEINR